MLFKHCSLRTKTSVVSPSILLYYKLAISFLFNYLCVFIILSQSCGDEKAIFSWEGILISESALGVVSHNCYVADCIQHHDLGVSEYQGDQKQYQGKKGTNDAAKLIFTILYFHRRRLAEVIKSLDFVTSRVDKSLETSFTSFSFLTCFLGLNAHLFYF